MPECGLGDIVDSIIAQGYAIVSQLYGRYSPCGIFPEGDLRNRNEWLVSHERLPELTNVDDTIAFRQFRLKRTEKPSGDCNHSRKV